MNKPAPQAPPYSFSQLISPEMKVRFLARKVEDLAHCKVFLPEGKWTELETIGHRLKGSGVSFGFPDLGEIGGLLELQAKAKDAELAQAAIALLEQWILNHPG
jgi:HPt (histidine-containing phosphotransfer) domain-containing protein